MEEDKQSIYNEEVLSPCNKACPAGINIPGYIALILEGREQDAYRLIRNNNPFPAITGRVCPHPCESKCRRLEIDEAVSICVLKAYAAEDVRQLPTAPIELTLPKKKNSVGIIGAGPAGLSCAYFLAKLGYQVTVYESQPVPGGMASTGIPQYRLPMDTILWEIEMITRLGVKILLNTTIGKDISFQELESRHQAIFIAVGLPKGTSLNLPGENANGVYQAVDFLRDVKLNLHLKKPLPKIGKRVMVIGGGNVAVDSVRTARRMGAEKIYMYCLENRDQMPAWQHEVEEAIEEGVCLENGWGPREIFTDKKNNVEAVVFKQCTEVFNAEGRFAPQYCDDNDISVDVDTVIMAVGQSPATEFIQNIEGIQFFRNRWPIADATTFATGRKGVFAGGDVLKPGLLIEAIAHGRNAAKSIDVYLGGSGKLYLDTTIQIPTPHLYWSSWSIDRSKFRFIDIEQRKVTFNEVTELMNKSEALHECNRCLVCEPSKIDEKKCIGCGTCVKNCPYDAISFKITHTKDFFGDRIIRTANVDPTLCHTCAICLSDCPVNAISFNKWSDAAYLSHLKSAMETYLKGGTA